ncbi:AhpD-like protein, partial [Mycena maculata]
KRDDNLPARARVPYSVFPPPGIDPVSQALSSISPDSIRARMANDTLLDLDDVLCRYNVIRSNNTLPAAMRELIILRVLGLNSATYQWLRHEPVARMAGLATEQLLVVRLPPPFFFVSQGLNFTTTLGPDLVAATSFTDWITQNVHVPDDVSDAPRPFLNDLQLVDATTIAAAYNSASRLVVASNVDDQMDVPVPILVKIMLL